MKIRRIKIGSHPGIQVPATIINVVPIPMDSRKWNGPTHIALLNIDGKVGSANLRWYELLSVMDELQPGVDVEVYAKNSVLLEGRNDRWTIDTTSLW